MRATKILLIENMRSNGSSFAVALKRKYQVHVARSGQQGLTLARQTSPDVIVLDAASLRTSGNRICTRLRSNLGELPIIHIRPPDAAGDTPADVLLVPPFTARKLINRIQRFAPAEGDDVLEVGPFLLNLAQQTLTTPWSEKKLTPKLVSLMEIFLKNRDQTLERKELMQQVWKTDYMGDTRTLDVHIRWLREVIEPVPGKKRYLQTVRGVGYRFAVPDEDDSTESSS